MASKTGNKVYYNIILLIIFSIISVIVFGIGNTNGILALNAVIFICFFYLTVKNIDENIFMFSFLVCFFTFLLCGQILNRFMKVYYYNFPDVIEKHVDVCIFISLVGLCIGYFGVTRKRIKIKNNIPKIEYKNKKGYMNNIIQISKGMYYGCYVFWILTVIDVVLYVRHYGYTSYYISYSSRIPWHVRQIGYFAPTAFYIFLSTLPEKKDAKVPIMLYILYAFLSLGTGRRVNFITSLLIIFAYAMCRNKIKPGEKPWIGKKGIWAICLCVPILMGAMYLFEYIRSNNYVGHANDYSPIVGFFVRQGTSVNAVKYAELYKNNLDSEAHYSLYNILRWLQNSPFNSLFNLNLDFSFGNQSLSTALHGTYLADFVSYYANSYGYAVGTGYGSCYFEELYIDYGYIGVFIGNIIYGLTFRLLSKIISDGKNVWKIAVGLFMLNSLFQAPRSTFDAFVGRLLYPEFWAPIIIIWGLAYLTSKSKHKIVI